MVRILSLVGKGINHNNFVIPLLISSYLNLFRWIVKNFGKVLINVFFSADCKDSQVSHLNLSFPVNFSGFE